MAVKFGTSGLRGLSVDLVGSVSALHATAFCRHLVDLGLSSGSPIVIGQDFRPSSPEIASTVMAAVARMGFKPVDCGTIPTPALALYGTSIGAAGLMITGSHIPADRNGIKFYRPDGEIDKQDEDAITRLARELATDASANLVETGSGEQAETEATGLFLKRNLGVLAPEALAGKRIGVYQHSSVARDMLVSMLEAYGATVFPLGRSDRFIPVDTEAVSDDTIRLLAGWSDELGLDSILSTDGDGDRPLVTDEHGLPLRGDFLGLLSAGFLDARVVATPVTSNSGLERDKRFEISRTRVGSPYVIAAMNEAIAAGRDRVLGFEANGGLMLGTDFSLGTKNLKALPTRDSFLPALAALGTAANRGLPLSRLVDDFKLPVALSDRLENYPTERSQALMQALTTSRAALDDFLSPLGNVRSINEVDGLRLTLTDDRVIHLRPSGNAPEMRCYVEAADQNSARDLLERGLALIASWKG
ncbi:phosphomannomutase [Rhizobium sp. AAP43]|uniref:phosphomannomutase n=1 Tax=Rhizobium sp. AAP43 TaxID=1523420 RepID=UPI0006B9B896|nr:phosphomannomutase [Rhizobium sp. AAP43]KPF44460.1 phosphomannomutase [Rhizobium sp. AAP43]